MSIKFNQFNSSKMKEKYFLKKVGWLKYPLACLLIYPISSIANPHPTNEANKSGLLQQKRTRTIVGTILDDNDDTPIIGANIYIKGTQSGAISLEFNL